MTEFDTSVIEDLVETLEDGRKGFSEAAEKLREDGRTQLAGADEGILGSTGPLLE